MKILVACEESQKEEREKERSKTFIGVARAMAEQWGKSLAKKN